MKDTPFLHANRMAHHRRARQMQVLGAFGHNMFIGRCMLDPPACCTTCAPCGVLRGHSWSPNDELWAGWMPMNEEWGGSTFKCGHPSKKCSFFFPESALRIEAPRGDRLGGWKDMVEVMTRQWSGISQAY